eukprot:508830-Prymnesium_polylepis.1
MEEGLWELKVVSGGSCQSQEHAPVVHSVHTCPTHKESIWRLSGAWHHALGCHWHAVKSVRTAPSRSRDIAEK